MSTAAPIAMHRLILIALMLAALAAAFFIGAARQPVRPLLSAEAFSNPDGFLPYRVDGVADHLSTPARDRGLFINMERQPDGRYETKAGRVESAPFQPSRHMAVPVMGPVHQDQQPFSGRLDPGAASVQLRCLATDRRLELLGSVNLEFHERVIELRPDWCAGPVQLVLEVRDARTQAGVGVPVAIGAWRALAQQPLGYAVAAFGMSALLTLLVAPFLMSSAGRPLQRYGVAMVYLGLMGYVLYRLAYGGAPGMVVGGVALAGLGLPILLAVGLAWRVRGRLDGADGESIRDAGEVLRRWCWGMGAAAILLTLLAAVLPLHGGAWFPNSAFYPVAWSTDNHLPTYMAKYALIHGTGHPPPLGPWSVTDRGFLPAGLVLWALHLLEFAGIRGPGGADHVLLHAWQFALMAAVVPMALQWVAAAPSEGQRPETRAEGWLLLFLLSVPFLAFNLVYVWPKLFSAVCALLMVAALDDALERRRAWGVILAGALAGLALVSHAATLFAMPWLMLAVLWHDRGRRSGWAEQCRQAWGLRWGIVLGAMMAAALVLAHDGLAPKTSYGATFALTGQGVFGLDAMGIWQAVQAHYASLSLATWWAHKLEGLAVLLYAFEPYNYYNAGCRVHGWLACVRAAQFSSVVPALGLIVPLVIVAVWQFRRPATLSARLAICATVGILLSSLTFQNLQVVHHLPYAFIMAWVLAGGIAWQRLSMPAKRAVSMAQALGFALVWILGALWTWRELGLG